MSVLRLQRYPHIKNGKLDYQIVNISMQPHGLQAAVASEFAAASTWEVMLLLVGRLQAQKFTSLVLIQQQLTSKASSCEAATALAASSATVCISKTRHGRHVLVTCNGETAVDQPQAVCWHIPSSAAETVRAEFCSTGHHQARPSMQHCTVQLSAS
jgi:hypothetical protein